MLACQAVEDEQDWGISWDVLGVLGFPEPVQANGAAVRAPQQLPGVPRIDGVLPQDCREGATFFCQFDAEAGMLRTIRQSSRQSRGKGCSRTGEHGLQVWVDRPQRGPVCMQQPPAPPQNMLGQGAVLVCELRRFDGKPVVPPAQRRGASSS